LRVRNVPRRDRAKQNEYQRQWYARNKEKAKAVVTANKHKYRQRWRDYKAALKCVNCGFDQPAALDFHHVIKAPDNRAVNELLRKDAFKAAYEEIKKCVVLCANCHRVHHADERLVKKQKRKRKKAKSRQP
jgi:hypothetical protein